MKVPAHKIGEKDDFFVPIAKAKNDRGRLGRGKGTSKKFRIPRGEMWGWRTAELAKEADLGRGKEVKFVRKISGVDIWNKRSEKKAGGT